MITVLSGGTGTPKLLQGIKEIIEPEDLTVVVNTLENDYFSNVYVAADIDTVIYTLAGLINMDTWYGPYDDTFITYNKLKELGHTEPLRLGDKDRALKMHKTELLKNHTLTEAVEIQKNAFGIKSTILPMSNQDSFVKIDTEIGILDFHEFLIKYKAEVEVNDVYYSIVKTTNQVIDAIKDSDCVIIGPSNPITSINPIVSIPQIKKALEDSYVVCVSPFIGSNPVSGPASKFMKAKGYEANCLGVCKLYKDFIDECIIHNTDKEYIDYMNKYVTNIKTDNILLKTDNDKIHLAKVILEDYIKK